MGAVIILGWLASKGTFAVLQPSGTIAEDERHLIILASLMSLIVVIPVFILTGLIVWRYRADNHRAKYQPNWDHNRVAESIWWLIPGILIAILAVITWQSTHALDPTKAIASNKPTLHVQVIALNWKWLFIYPEQHIATVNHLMLPVGRPVHFDITSDAPMNSFWIPQLGGQIYAMTGMSTQLNLRADKAGDYRGSSANISGSGFARMTFTATAMPETSFQAWLSTTAQKGLPTLDKQSYAALAKPSTGNSEVYSSVEPGIYQTTVHKYMHGDME